MRRKQTLQGGHLIDGKYFTDDEFIAMGGYIYKSSVNAEHMQWSEPRLDPNYAAKEGLKREYIRAAKKRIELEVEQTEIAKKLASLT